MTFTSNPTLVYQFRGEIIPTRSFIIPKTHCKKSGPSQVFLLFNYLKLWNLPAQRRGCGTCNYLFAPQEIVASNVVAAEHVLHEQVFHFAAKGNVSALVHIFVPITDR